MTGAEDLDFLRAESPGLPVLGALPADPAVIEADRLGVPVYDHVPAMREAAAEILSELESARHPEKT